MDKVLAMRVVMEDPARAVKDQIALVESLTILQTKVGTLQRERDQLEARAEVLKGGLELVVGRIAYNMDNPMVIQHLGWAAIKLDAEATLLEATLVGG